MHLRVILLGHLAIVHTCRIVNPWAFRCPLLIVRDMHALIILAQPMHLRVILLGHLTIVHTCGLVNQWAFRCPLLIVRDTHSLIMLVQAMHLRVILLGHLAGVHTCGIVNLEQASLLWLLHSLCLVVDLLCFSLPSCLPLMELVVARLLSPICWPRSTCQLKVASWGHKNQMR